MIGRTSTRWAAYYNHAYTGEEMYPDRTTAPDIAVAMVQDPISAEPKEDADQALVEFINACIAVDAADRPSSAGECLETVEELKNHVEGRPPETDAPVLFYDPLTDLVDWSEYGRGRLTVAADPSGSPRRCVHKVDFTDPNGGYRHIGSQIGRGWRLRVRIYSPPVDQRSGTGDRVSLENDSFDGYGVLVNHRGGVLGLERRTKGSAQAIGTPSIGNELPEESWYDLQLELTIGGVLKATLEHEGTLIAEVEVRDDAVKEFHPRWGTVLRFRGAHH